MTAQLTYAINQPKAYEGLIVAQASHDIISRSVEGVAGVAFAVVVSRGTDKEKQAVLGGTNGFLGITIRDLGREGAINDSTVKYSEKETAGIMRDGYIWAKCPTGCNPGDPVNFTEVTGILDSGVPSGVGETGLDDCFWDSVAAAGELAILRVKNVEKFTAGT